MPFEKEIRRYIRPDVTILDIVNLLKSKYTVKAVKQKTIYDLYFKESTDLPADTKVREENDRLEPTLKIPIKKSEYGVLEREKITDVNEICKHLGIAPVNSKQQLLRELDKRFGREFILEQNRTLVYLIGTEVALDMLQYHWATDAQIPPIRNALGDVFHTEKIYEAEATPDREFLYFVTEYLVAKGLLGKVCEERKEEIGRRILSERK